ncbi:MAG: DUF4132 domain-containing protein [Burkholderiaceae bacterium]|nr:DUF4132 domain-containing protein [Burkholderiaceae bacterium]
MGVLDSARRAFGSEQTLIRDGLRGLDLIAKDLTARAVDFVAGVGDPAVLLELAQHGGAAGILLGRPGHMGWSFHGNADANHAAGRASSAARHGLYRLVVNDEQHVTMLVRLGKVLEAADQRQLLNHTGTFAPDWLQYLLNDALWGSYPNHETDRKDEERPAWDIRLVAALLAADGFPQAMLLPILFERREMDNYFQERVFRRLLASGALDDYMLTHIADVEAAAKVLSAVGRNLLVNRIGGNPQLVAAFGPLLVKLAVGDSKVVRASAARFIDGMDHAQANGHLAALLSGGQTEERSNAIDLLARTQGERAIPVLAAALKTESSKPVQQTIRNAIARLQAAEEASDAALPEPPPLPPEPQQVLGDDVLDVLLKNRDELLERLRKGAEAEIESNRSASYKYRFQQEAYARYRRLDASQLRAAIKALNGLGGKPGNDALGDPEVSRTLAASGRVEARADFGLLQVLRWIAAQGSGSYWGVWNHPHFQTWLGKQDPANVDLRQVVTLMKQCGGDAESIYRCALRDPSPYAQLPQHTLPAERVWPLFAARPDLIDEGLGMAATSGEQYSAPQLGGTLSVLATFPVIPARWMPRLMELALGDGKTHRAAAQQVLSRVPGIGKLVCDALASNKQELRIEAARWLVSLDYRAGIPALRTALDKESRETASAAIMTALEQLGEDISPYLSPATLLAQAQKGLKGKAPASMAWLNLDAAPACHWRDGTPVQPDIIRWWVILACKLKEPAGNALLERYLGLLAQPGRAALGGWLLHQFIARDTLHPSLEEGIAWAQANASQRYQQYQDWARRHPDYYAAQGKLTPEQVFEEVKREKMAIYLGSAISDKGLLALVSGLPGHELVGAVQGYMRDHYQRRAQIEALLEAACVSNDASVIQFTLGIARRYRTASVQEKARVLVQRIAERNGWTPDQLADRTVPTGGLDDSGRLTLHYGRRLYTVTLDAALKPVLRNEDGKIVSALPAPRQDDVAESVKEAKQQLTACKKEVKQAVEMQASRLYEAMCAGRLWPLPEWRSYLQQHPIVGRLVQQLVWQALDADGNALGLFRPTEDGSLIDVHDDEVALDAQSLLRVAHGALLEDGDASAWLAHFKDYKLTPLFAQMTRKLPAQRGGDSITDRLGWISDAFTLRGSFNKRGYQRAAAEDGGVFYEYSKPFASAGLTVVIAFSGNALPEENLPAALKSLSFRRMDGQRYHHRTLALDQVPPVLLAEAYGDYLAVAATCSGHDPEWEKKMPW